MRRQGLEKEEVQSDVQSCFSTDSLWPEVEIEAQLLDLGHKGHISPRDLGPQLRMKMPMNFSETE